MNILDEGKISFEVAKDNLNDKIDRAISIALTAALLITLNGVRNEEYDIRIDDRYIEEETIGYGIEPVEDTLSRKRLKSDNFKNSNKDTRGHGRVAKRTRSHEIAFEK